MPTAGMPHNPVVYTWIFEMAQAATLRCTNMSKSGLRVAFVGPSGSGKSTCFRYAFDAIRDAYYPVIVHRADVATPLHEIQHEAYGKFGIIAREETSIEGTRQDGKLLAFLAEHFEPYLGSYFIRQVDETSSKDILAAFVNTDCRDNAYTALYDAGFWFIQMRTPPSIIKERLGERGDFTEPPIGSSVESTGEIVPHWRITNDGSLDALQAEVIHAIDMVGQMRYEYLLHPRMEQFCQDVADYHCNLGQDRHDKRQRIAQTIHDSERSDLYINAAIRTISSTPNSHGMIIDDAVDVLRIVEELGPKVREFVESRWPPRAEQDINHHRIYLKRNYYNDDFWYSLVRARENDREFVLRCIEYPNQSVKEAAIEGLINFGDAETLSRVAKNDDFPFIRSFAEEGAQEVLDDLG